MKDLWKTSVLHLGCLESAAEGAAGPHSLMQRVGSIAHPGTPIAPLSAADHCIKDHRSSLLKAVLILGSFDLFNLIFACG